MEWASGPGYGGVDGAGSAMAGVVVCAVVEDENIAGSRNWELNHIDHALWDLGTSRRALETSTAAWSLAEVVGICELSASSSRVAIFWHTAPRPPRYCLEPDASSGSDLGPHWP